MKVSFIIAGLYISITLFSSHPASAAKRNWIKYCQSGKVTQQDRQKCRQLLNILRKSTNTVDEMKANLTCASSSRDSEIRGLEKRKCELENEMYYQHRRN